MSNDIRNSTGWVNIYGTGKVAKHQRMNLRSFQNYMERLMNMAMNSFDWLGLPKTVSKRFLEMTLMNQGYCVFFKDPELGYLVQRCAMAGQLDEYGIPVKVQPVTVSGRSFPVLDRTKGECVLIWNNYTHTPTLPILEQFAERLARLERTVDININAQKTPYVYVTDEKTRLSIVNMQNQIEAFKPAIIAHKGIDINDAVNVLNPGASFIADKLEIQKRRIWNEAMTFIGVYNQGMEKRERLVADEADNYGDVDGMRNVFLNARQDAVDEIREIYPDLEDLTVRYKQTDEELLAMLRQIAEIDQMNAQATEENAAAENEQTMEEGAENG